jgi:hypothetical protein
MAREKAVLYAPTVFKQIDLGNPLVDKEKARLAVQKYSGRVALVKDLHRTKDNYYPLGVLRVDPDDEQCYYFALVRGYEKIKKSDGLLIKIDEENEKRLYYHDLKELLVNDPS